MSQGKRKELSMLSSGEQYAIQISEETFRLKWGWFIALGFSLLVIGMFAFSNLIGATVLSVYWISIMMIVGGALQTVQSLQLNNWNGFGYLLLSGALYTIAGIMAFENPVLAVATFTLLLAIDLIFQGVAFIGFAIS